MLASARQVAILEIIDRDGGAQLRHLADLFGVSTGTIRRDLTVLHASGLVARVHRAATHEVMTPRPDLVLLIDAQTGPDIRAGLVTAGIRAYVAHGRPDTTLAVAHPGPT